MPTSRAQFDPAFAKLTLILNGLVPAAILAWGGWHGQLGVNPTSYALHTTGLVGLLCLLLSLAITPVRKLTGWAPLLAFRRGLGLLGFFYICGHFAIYIVLDRGGDLGSVVDEILARRYLLIGAIGLLAMVPLALTSTDGMIARLGGKRWKLLHRLAYVAGAAGVIHFYLLVKSDVTRPQVFAVTLIGLLGYRAVGHYVDLRRAARRRPTLPPAQARTFWTGELRVARIFVETPDIRTFRLVAVDGGPLPFTHLPGQYLTLTVFIDGKKVRRSYTIASSPTRRDYVEVSIKRQAHGWISGHLHQTLAEGSLLQVAAPAGHFGFTGDRTLAGALAVAPTRVLMLAGGVGITPIMAMVRYLTDRCWPGTIHVLYAVRTSADIAFAEELAYLGARFPTLRVVVTISGDDATWTGARGHITQALITHEVPDLTHVPIFMCGPGPMMAAMRSMLVERLGVANHDLHDEAFVSPPSTPEGAPDEAASAVATPDAIAAIQFRRAGRKVELPMATTVLEAAEAAGVDIAFECRSGICGQCKTRLVSGRVTMDSIAALSASERARGVILACQAHPCGDIVVDA